MSGVTPDGFEPKTLDEVLDDIQAEQLANISPSLNLSSSSVIGQFNGIFAERLAEIWQVLQATYQALDPASAEGQALDNILTLNGIRRLEATFGTVDLELDLDAATTVPQGSIVSVTGASTKRYVTDAAVTSVGAGTYTVSATAETVGDYGVVLAGTVEEIETPVTGWNSVTNPLDAERGRDRETDTEARFRRIALLARGGKGTVSAIRADVLSVEDVTEAVVYENATDLVDGDGVPAHAFEAVVLGGAANDIAQAIFDSKPAGIAAHGGTSGNATDEAGGTHVVEFTRPTQIDVLVEVEVTVDGDYPVDGDTQIQAVIAAFGDELDIAQDVFASRMFSEVFAIPGVVDIVSLKLGISADTPPYTRDTVAIGTREVARIDSGDVTVTS